MHCQSFLSLKQQSAFEKHTVIEENDQLTIRRRGEPDIV